jgi:hypothetical protein
MHELHVVQGRCPVEVLRGSSPPTLGGERPERTQFQECGLPPSETTVALFPDAWEP